MAAERFAEVGEIKSAEDVAVFASRLAPVFTKRQWRWLGCGIPNERAVASRIEYLMEVLRDGSTEAYTGGLLIEIRGTRRVLMADRELTETLQTKTVSFGTIAGDAAPIVVDSSSDILLEPSSVFPSSPV